MNNLQLYSNAQVYVKNVGLLSEQNSVTVEKKGGLIPNFTSVSGFAGMTQGAMTAELTIDNCVPSADFEMNPDPFMRLGEVMEVTVFLFPSGKKSVFQGFITDSTFSNSINEASKLTIKLMCRHADWEG